MIQGGEIDWVVEGGRIFGFLPTMWETWIVFLTPGFDTDPAPTVVDIFLYQINKNTF